MRNPQQELEQALRGLDYPATREKLITKALENGASPSVIARIREFPETADFLNEERFAAGVRDHGAG